MTGLSTELYYDPYDFDIDRDPYPVWKRMRDEAPLYYNPRYEFYAVSRFDDVERCSVDWKTYVSGKGSVLELIKSRAEIPPGNILFEDPPAHDLHRGLLSRVFTPRRMLAIEPQVRAFCARSLDPLIGAKQFDFIQDLGSAIWPASRAEWPWRKCSSAFPTGRSTGTTPCRRTRPPSGAGSACRLTCRRAQAFRRAQTLRGAQTCRRAQGVMLELGISFPQTGLLLGTRTNLVPCSCG